MVPAAVSFDKQAVICKKYIRITPAVASNPDPEKP
jgi:hypothetical protein